ncbi:ankyrin repeat-containing domain protein [Lipomyces tetrasporus]|uniref:Ankyrin repeat-containing domain protein n=1 Tax=Lipomyces tetrasporus TaxID=54092 RepID=A0AAD7QR36_9ASCO|nr:ankyrin repeat-containing domain protein [Lipomyces tetrasporus]KAJ8099753.1 ankyrin repeat-containing domain protein [Lipomyces tetrasporus]
MPRELTEDEIDNLIYSARVDDLDTLKLTIESLSSELNQSESHVLLQAVDPYSKSSPLHMACANGHLDIVEYILSKFSSRISDSNPSIVKLKNDSGNTPLHWACLNGHQRIIEKLCDSGADPFEKNLAGQDCFFQAENNEKLDVVDYLLQRYQEVLYEEEDTKTEQIDTETLAHAPSESHHEEREPETNAMES